MAYFKIEEGDTAKVVEPKSLTYKHGIPVGTTVRVVKRCKHKSGCYNTYYCTALDGEQKGLTQILTTSMLEKIKN